MIKKLIGLVILLTLLLFVWGLYVTADARPINQWGYRANCEGYYWSQPSWSYVQYEYVAGRHSYSRRSYSDVHVGLMSDRDKEAYC